MNQKSQFEARDMGTGTRIALVCVLVISVLPSLGEFYAVIWGALHGMTGKALRAGLVFWAGGFLAWHGRVPEIFDSAAYNGFLQGLYGAKLPFHMWSYPPNYLLIATVFGGFSPFHAVLAFDAASLLLLVFLLRLGWQSWPLIAAVVLSPVSFENILEGQNAALMTALIGGGLLLAPMRPRLGGLLIGLASIKPQLGVVLPLYLLRRAPIGFFYALMVAMGLFVVSGLLFGPLAWLSFFNVTGPAMSQVLLTGKPPEFAAGLISVFAAVRFLGVHGALVVQAVVSVAAMGYAVTRRDAASVLVLAALASPYLHDYDLLGVALAVALIAQNGLRHGFAPGEPVLLFVAWFGPGALPWLPQFAHFTPVILLLLLASAARYGRLSTCDSSVVQPGLPASSVGRSPIPDPPKSTAPG
jgi:alpha-1,2-mannosyltransferase